MTSTIMQNRMVRLQLVSADRTVCQFSAAAWWVRCAGSLPGVTVTVGPFLQRRGTCSVGGSLVPQGAVVSIVFPVRPLPHDVLGQLPRARALRAYARARQRTLTTRTDAGAGARSCDVDHIVSIGVSSRRIALALQGHGNLST